MDGSHQIKQHQKPQSASNRATQMPHLPMWKTASCYSLEDKKLPPESKKQGIFS